MIDIAKERMRLITLIEEYLAGSVSAQQLTEYAWSIIDSFTDHPERQMPQDENAERDFWYAIWQVQHLVDQEHMALLSTRTALAESLQILKGSKLMPAHYIGRRPISRGESN